MAHRSLAYTPKDRSLVALLELPAFVAPAEAEALNIMRLDLQRLTALFRHTRYGRLAMYDEHEVTKLQRKLGNALDTLKYSGLLGFVLSPFNPKHHFFIMILFFRSKPMYYPAKARPSLANLNSYNEYCKLK
ncbi:hypothetical protein ACFOET_08720 [Parapedobacter deserti]|uniref:Uncharacterized protein n=1 Tax=Parapedobacter deserti TaxID=1912957 RepID=A0ABV7JMZ5_9SPHI